MHLEIEHSAQPIKPLNLDPMRIEQIINNLFSNALRHTPPGGKIRVRTQAFAKTAEQPSIVQLVVWDSGPGIPPEALGRIFERFYRADRSRSRAEGGTGLGLAIARRLTELHGGNLTASNHAAGGAVFTLSLPMDVGPLDAA